MSVESSDMKHTARTPAWSDLFSLLLGLAVILGIPAPNARHSRRRRQHRGNESCDLGRSACAEHAMGSLLILEFLSEEFERAFAAAHRYDRLRCGPAVHDRPARSEIAERIFEEFYAGGGEAGKAERTRDPGRFLRLRFGLWNQRPCN